MELPQWLRGKDAMQGAWFYLWVEKIPWRRKWQPTQYSCLENLIDRGVWWATVHGVSNSRT